MRRPGLTSLLPALLVTTLAAVVGARWIASTGERSEARIESPGSSPGATSPVGTTRPAPPAPPLARPPLANDEPRPSGGALPWIESLGEGLRRAAAEGRLCLVYLQRPPDT